MKKNSSFLRFGFLSAVFLFGMSMSFVSTAQDAAPAAEAPADTSLDSPTAVSDTASDSANPTSAALPPEILILNQIEEELKEKFKNDIYIPPAIPSLIFTSEQQSLLREARNGFNTRIPLASETGEPVKTDPKLPTASRRISLSGIIFINPDEWTIWLNKKRVTSANLPKEAVDLRVYKEFIELKWFDAETNQIFPIRLRPNQTFSLDAHTFVPG